MNNKIIRQISGFTLLELMVTIAVVVILVTFGVPAFRTTIANNHIEAVSNSLRNSLVTARNKAIETASRVTVSPESIGDWNRWQIDSGQIQSATDVVNIYGKTSADNDIVSIVFTEDGSLDEESLEYRVFSICYNGSVDGIKPKAVVVSPGGLVLIKDEMQLIDLEINCPSS